MENYIIVIEQRDVPGGKIYGAFAPDVPGCVATGATVERVLAQITLSLASALRSLNAAGKTIPQPESYEEHRRRFRQAGESLDDVLVALAPCPEEYRRRQTRAVRCE